MELLLSPMHASRPRNRLIAQALYDMGVIEHYGRGRQMWRSEMRCVRGRNLRYNTCVNLQKESGMRYSGAL